MNKLVNDAALKNAKLSDIVQIADNLISEDGFQTDNQVDVTFSTSAFVFLGVGFVLMVGGIAFYFLVKKKIK